MVHGQQASRPSLHQVGALSQCISPMCEIFLCMGLDNHQISQILPQVQDEHFVGLYSDSRSRYKAMNCGRFKWFAWQVN